MTKKKYKLPADARVLFIAAQAEEKLAKYLITVPFFFKKAISLQTKAEEKRFEAWGMIKSLYKDINVDGTSWTANADTGYITKMED